MIKFEKVTKNYRQGTKTIKAVDGINLTINEGEFVVVSGPSGSGKSTFLQLVGGLDRPTSGEVTIAGQKIAKMKESQLTKLRRQTIGFIFQNFNLIPTLSAQLNVEAGLPEKAQMSVKKASELLNKIGLEGRKNHLPTLLSGGEQQRVAIARSLIHDPKIVLADEPTGNLDSQTGREIMTILEDLNQKSHKTVIVVTHSDYVLKYATKVIKMRDGKITITK